MKYIYNTVRFFQGKKNLLPYFVDTWQNQYLSKLFRKPEVTLHNYSIVQLKDKVKKRNFPTILYINFLLVSPCTSRICIAIPVCHKQSPCNLFYQAIYALPKSTLHSIRQAIGLHYTNIPILPAQRRLSINASNCKTAMCVFFLKRTLIRACQFCKINSLQSLQLICQQITIKVIPPKSSKAFWIRQKTLSFILMGQYLKLRYQSGSCY